VTIWDEFGGIFIILFFGYVIAINAVTAFLFWTDKRAAIANDSRVPEADLLFCAFIGGSLGAYWSGAKFRHKTKKQPFSSILLAIQIVHLGLAGGALFLWFDALIG